MTPAKGTSQVASDQANACWAGPDMLLVLREVCDRPAKEVSLRHSGGRYSLAVPNPLWISASQPEALGAAG